MVKSTSPSPTRPIAQDAAIFLHSQEHQNLVENRGTRWLLLLLRLLFHHWVCFSHRAAGLRVAGSVEPVASDLEELVRLFLEQQLLHFCSQALKPFDTSCERRTTEANNAESRPTWLLEPTHSKSCLSQKKQVRIIEKQICVLVFLSDTKYPYIKFTCICFSAWRNTRPITSRWNTGICTFDPPIPRTQPLHACTLWMHNW